jgi:methylase of polypeptide subunit release factors
LLEVGYNQAEAVEEIFQKANLKLVEIAKDLAGINRCVILKNLV